MAVPDNCQSTDTVPLAVGASDSLTTNAAVAVLPVVKGSCTEVGSATASSFNLTSGTVVVVVVGKQLCPQLLCKSASECW